MEWILFKHPVVKIQARWAAVFQFVQLLGSHWNLSHVEASGCDRTAIIIHNHCSVEFSNFTCCQWEGPASHLTGIFNFHELVDFAEIGKLRALWATYDLESKMTARNWLKQFLFESLLLNSYSISLVHYFEVIFHCLQWWTWYLKRNIRSIFGFLESWDDATEIWRSCWLVSFIISNMCFSRRDGHINLFNSIERIEEWFVNFSKVALSWLARWTSQTPLLITPGRTLPTQRWKLRLINRASKP